MVTKYKFLVPTAVVMVTALALASCDSSDGNHAAVPANSTARTASLNAYTPEQGSTPLTSCNIETLDNTVFAVQPSHATTVQTHSLSGWIASPHVHDPKYWLRFDDKSANRYFEIPVTPSLKRPDVAAVAGNEAFPIDTGFTANVPVSALPAGEYHVYLAAIDGTAVYACDNGRQIIFK